MKPYKRGLFIFHRDFRITDNIGLYRAAQMCEKVYTIFVFTPDQVTKNRYKSDNAVQFMIESLEDLASQLKRGGGRLLTFYDTQNNVIERFIKTVKVDALFFNKDYTPYAVERDNSAEKLCNKYDIPCIMEHDYYLYEPGSILSGSKDIYKKYTPFYDHVVKLPVEKPIKSKPTNLNGNKLRLPKQINLKRAMNKFTDFNENILVHGGRKIGLKRLDDSLKEQRNYTEDRDTLSYSTSFLSAYLKFGCVSIREVYHAYKKKYGRKHGLIRELIWRDFFAHILYRFPEVMGSSYIQKLKKLNWRNNKKDFKKWCKGETGYPVVDAGMRQLNKTGYMHNRCRMIVADFLVKTLLIDWRWGERYFAQKLTDYDIASNNGNWQNISSTGVQTTPYFRNFNPFIQSKKFDKDCVYIKTWIQELKDVDPKDIHKWDTNYVNYNVDYPPPMIDYTSQKRQMLQMYKKAYK